VCIDNTVDIVGEMQPDQGYQENEQTKVCPLCAETIKSAAQVCPFCRAKQVRYALWRQELTVAVPTAVLVIVALLVMYWIVPDEEGVGGRNFSGHQGDLVVLSSLLERGRTKPDFWLTGVLSNRGDHPWRVHELEVRFRNERGDLLDVIHPSVEELLVVQSHQEHGFRVSLGPLAFTNSGVTRQVRVQVATEGDRVLKPD
jgi:hypothetical protein